MIVLDGEAEDRAVAELMVRAGSAFEAADEAGLTSVLAGVLAAEVEVGAGTVVLGGAEPDRLAFRVLTPPDSLVPITRRLLGVLSGPALARDAVEMERTRVRAALQSRLLSPEAVAARSLTQRVFPAHPYGVLETPATIATLDREAMVSFHRAHVGPAGALLVVGGVGASEAIRTELQTLLTGWRDPAPPEAGAASGPSDPGDSSRSSPGVGVHIVDDENLTVHDSSVTNSPEEDPGSYPREGAPILLDWENARGFRFEADAGSSTGRRIQATFSDPIPPGYVLFYSRDGAPWTQVPYSLVNDHTVEVYIILSGGHMEMTFLLAPLLPLPDATAAGLMTAPRFSLTFYAYSGHTYRVERTPGLLVSDWSNTLFAPIPGGMATQELLTATGGVETIYLDAGPTSEGYYRPILELPGD